MPSIEEALIAKLYENGYSLWTQTWTAVVSRVLARATIASFDFTAGRLTGRLPPINDPLWRVRAVEASGDTPAYCESELMRHFEALNTAITAASDGSGRRYDRRTEPRMRKLLSRVYVRLTSSPVSNGIVATVSPVDIWRAIADELGRTIHRDIGKTFEVADSLLQNQLLFAGYFWACNLPSGTREGAVPFGIKLFNDPHEEFAGVLEVQRSHFVILNCKGPRYAALW